MSTVVNTNSAIQQTYHWLTSNAAIILILATLVLFISKSLYNVPISIMALIGLWRFVLSPKQIWHDKVIRIYILLFLCLWIPQLISYIDAVNYGRSAETVFPYLRFLFFGIYVLQEIQKPKLLNIITVAIFFIVSFWCIDAVIQFFFKTNLFGVPYEAGQLRGMFPAKSTIAHVAACLSPLYFDLIRKHTSRLLWLWILILPLFMVVLLSGRRAAWVMLIVSTIGYLFYLISTDGKKKFLKKLYLIGAAILSTAILTINLSSFVQDRISQTMGLFNGDYESADIATARRLPIWATSWAMFKDNWVNGVGPRGFRFVYREYSQDDSYWIEKKGASTVAHPHQLILEVATETGVIGILGLAVFAFLFYQHIKKHNLFIALFPWVLTIIVAVFPINSHMAFYGSYWSSMIWWLMALSFAAMNIHIKNNGDLAGTWRTT